MFFRASILAALSAVPALGQDPAIPELIERLGSDDPKERDAASARLLKIGEPALEDLERRRDDADLELRERARELMRRLDSTFSLIEDLQSDDTPGNMARARRLLFKRIRAQPEKTLRRLLECSTGGDLQAATVASYILYHTGHRQELLGARPRLFAECVGDLCLGRVLDIEWMAMDLTLGLWRHASPEAVDAAFDRALRGQRPAAALKICRQLLFAFRERLAGFKESRSPRAVLGKARLPLPRPLIRLLIQNLRDDTEMDNANRAADTLGELGDAVHVELTAALDSLDRQGKRLALSILAPALAPPFPESVLRALAEHPTHGLPPREDLPRWVPHLLAAVGQETDAQNLERILLIARIDPGAGKEALTRIAIRALASDNHGRNAVRAVEALALWGDPLPLLPVLESSDPQAAVAAYVALGRMGRLPTEAPLASIRDLLSRREDWDDEWECAAEAIQYLGPEKHKLLRDVRGLQSWKLDRARRYVPGEWRSRKDGSPRF